MEQQNSNGVTENFPNQANVEYAIRDLFLPLRDYMIDIIQKCEGNKSRNERQPLESAVNMLDRATEMKHLAKFLTESDTKNVFVDCYCEVKKINWADRESVSEDFINKVISLYIGRNRSAHGDSHKGNGPKDFSSMDTLNYATTLILLAEQIGESKLAENLRKKFGLIVDVPGIWSKVGELELKNTNLMSDNDSLGKQVKELTKKLEKLSLQLQYNSDKVVTRPVLSVEDVEYRLSHQYLNFYDTVSIESMCE